MTRWDAVQSFLTLLVVISIVALVYGFLLRRLATFVQPLRLRLAERGEKYLVVCKDPKERKLITFYLDKALSPWIAIWTSVLLPVVVLRQIFKPSDDIIIKEDENEYNRIVALFTISVFAANPLFGMIVLLEAAVILILTIILSGKVNMLMRASVALIERIAMKTEERRHHHAAAH